MMQCHKCGRNIPKNSGVYRIVKTGSYSSGQNYYRNVNLCPQCDAGQDSMERSRNIKKVLVVIGALVTLISASVYLLFIR